MMLDAVRTSAVDQLPSFLIYDTIDASAAASAAAFLSDNAGGGALPAAAAGGRRKRRRRARSCKNKEEAESQRMTHIAVERNRRRQMNEYLAVLRSLMPDSYVHRGDQASIVGGAIDFVKELEQLLQSLEAQKRTLLATQHQRAKCDTMPAPCSATRIDSTNNCSSSGGGGGGGGMEEEAAAAYDARPPFAEFFSYPQYAWCHSPRDCAPLTVAENRSAVADVEVALVETHANVRVMSARRPGQLLRLVAGLQSLGLAVLHLNVTTLDTLVLYSLSVKVEEGCSLSTVDDIAGAVHDVLSIIDAEVASQQPQVVVLSRGQ